LLHLDAADFGVPQRRKRVFVLGCRDGEYLPVYPTARKERVTVSAALDDLKIVNRARLSDGDSYSGPLGKPSPYSQELRRPQGRSKPKALTGFARTEHSDEVVERFKQVKQGGVDAVSRFIRLDPKSVSPTLRAGTGPENGSFMAPRPIHPDYPRCITVREAARLHSFPDWFEFHETKWHGFMQVGNSVPPALARAVAIEVTRSLKGTSRGTSAVTGDDFASHGDRPVAQHGTGASCTVNSPRAGSTVSSRQS
jgi:DNA (cytosine-5)-methyltransferase 1